MYISGAADILLPYHLSIFTQAVNCQDSSAFQRMLKRALKILAFG